MLALALLDVSDPLALDDAYQSLPASAYTIAVRRFSREMFDYYEYCVVNDPTMLDEIRSWAATILAAPGPQPIPQLAASGREWAAAREWAARVGRAT